MTISFNKEKFLADPETKKIYDEIKPEFDIVAALIQARVESNLTQTYEIP